jgi:hypothetical protein
MESKGEGGSALASFFLAEGIEGWEWERFVLILPRREWERFVLILPRR